MSEQVQLYYHRPPDRTTLFVQDLLFESDEVRVTYMAATPLAAPVVVQDKIVLEDQAPVIWFTFPGLHHDIGRFHDRSGKCTGLYANIIAPVEFRSRLEWHATDLFLDIWLGTDGAVKLLDEDELAAAAARAWVSPATADRARHEANEILKHIEAGTWPPAVVNDWSLSRVIGNL